MKSIFIFLATFFFAVTAIAVSFAIPERSKFLDSTKIHWSLIVSKDDEKDKIISSSEINQIQKHILEHKDLGVKCEKPEVIYQYKNQRNFSNYGEERASFKCRLGGVSISSVEARCAKNYASKNGLRRKVYGDQVDFKFEKEDKSFKIRLICVVK